MQRRKLEELNLLDDFLFGSMVTYPGIGEKFVREILRTIFKKEFGRLTVVPQKIYYGSDTDCHGARLDVYLEDEDAGDGATVYDLEPEKNDDAESMEALPYRVRFYHAKIDARSLKSGESYRRLKKVTVIMIMSFDPFGRDRMVYTIRNMCQEIPEMPYDDGARTLFLYTRGKEGNPSKELQELLRYMEHTTEENAKNKSLQEIHKMVKTVKQDEEVSLEYMKIWEREEMLIRQGVKKGIEQERVNTERERANTERERANTQRERQRADAAEKEIVQLKKLIERMKKADTVQEADGKQEDN